MNKVVLKIDGKILSKGYNIYLYSSKRLITRFRLLIVRIIPEVKRYLIPLVILVLLLLSWFIFRYTKGAEDLINILPNLITATSIIVSILIGYLFTRLVEIRRTQNEKLRRFIELQEELSPYQEALYTLAESLDRNYSIDLQWKRNYFELWRDIKFLEDPSQKPHAVLFIRALYRIAKNRYEYLDPEIRNRLIAPEELDSVNECLMSLSGILCRRKYYKNVFSDLGIPLENDFSKVILQDFSRLKYTAELLPNESKIQWNTLAFWEKKINEALDITERMLGNASHIFIHTGKILKLIFWELLIVVTFGLFLPLLTLGFEFPSTVNHYLSYASLIGFILSFIAVLISVYKEISCKIVTSTE